MSLRAHFAAGLIALPWAAPLPALAQDAAETAIITAGTAAPQARASRSLGSAISGAMNRSAGAINIRSSSGSRPARAAGRQTDSSHTIAADVDVLENTDAAGYTLGNGAQIRVSGRLNPSAGTICTRNCPVNAAPEDEAPEESADSED